MYCLTGEGRVQYSQHKFCRRFSRAAAGMKRAVIASPRSGRLAQLVRAPALQAGGRGIEALTAHHLFSELRLDGLYNSAHNQRMKRQDGYLPKESGAWLGHYSRWITDYSTGQRKRQQRAFKIGPVSTLTKTRARDKLRERIVSELGITADSRVTLGSVSYTHLRAHETR